MGDAGAIVKGSLGVVEKGMQIASDQIINQQNIKHQEKWNERNEKLQKEVNAQQQQNWQTQFDYQKNLNETQMKREDTAIQRSVADHQAAGFNKLLAVGNQAASGGMTTFGGTANQSATQSEAPQLQASDLGNFLSQIGTTIMENKLNKAMISKTYAEATYTNQKTLTEIENTALKEIEKAREKLAKEKDEKMREMYQSIIDEQVEKVNVMRHNLGLAKKWNWMYGADPRANNPYQILTTPQESNDNRDSKPTEKAKEGTKGKAEQKKDGSGNYAVSQKNAPRGYGPPNNEEKKYAWYFDKKNGQWYRFGKIWYGE